LLLKQAVSRQISQWSNNVSLQVFLQPNVTDARWRASTSSSTSEGFADQDLHLSRSPAVLCQMRQLFVGNPTIAQVLTPRRRAVFRCQLVNPNQAA